MQLWVSAGDMSPVVVAAAIRKTNLQPRNPTLMQSWELNNNPTEQHGSGKSSGTAASCICGQI